MKAPLLGWHLVLEHAQMSQKWASRQLGLAEAVSCWLVWEAISIHFYYNYIMFSIPHRWLSFQFTHSPFTKERLYLTLIKRTGL